jgi:hypothetical protein
MTVNEGRLGCNVGMACDLCGREITVSHRSHRRRLAGGEIKVEHLVCPPRPRVQITYQHRPQYRPYINGTTAATWITW